MSERIGSGNEGKGGMSGTPCNYCDKVAVNWYQCPLAHMFWHCEEHQQQARIDREKCETRHAPIPDLMAALKASVTKL